MSHEAVSVVRIHKPNYRKGFGLICDGATV
jgi:hypothetical protein